MRLRRCLAVLVAGLAASGPAAAHPDGLTGSALPLPGRAAYSCGVGRYRVKPGDTLSSIARRFHTSVRRLAAANSLDPAAVLPAGIVLVIPKSDCERLRATPTAAVGAESTVVAALDRAVQVPGVSQARTGVVVVDLGSSTVIYALNPDAPLEPASTEKLPVAATALERLGGGFRIRTRVLGQGTLSGATWRGDIFLKGYGDPALTSTGLAGLAHAIRARGITSVTGHVVGDESYFDSERAVAGWKPSFAQTESPLLSALVVNRGILDGAAVDHPALAAAILFTRALQRAGVSVAGSPTVGSAGSTAVELTRRASPPLHTLLSQMDTWSDNFIAEMLLKTLGARLAGRGSSAAGAAAVRAALAADAVPLAGVRLVDGSGLSSLDRLTARSLAAILETVCHQPGLRPLLTSFAVAGSTGTLRHRLLDVPLHQLVRGKTGTTDHSSALAGFVGSRFAFAVLNNGSPVDWQAAHLLQDRIAEALLAAAG
jgi:D-alanyl-D-alanine carboxypeptidase/D-alanyl-D-alanine-endopeptidase (penicillin-binding protein 4)